MTICTLLVLLISFSCGDASRWAALPSKLLSRSNSPDFRVAFQTSAWVSRIVLRELRGGSTDNEDADEYEDYDESTGEDEDEVDEKENGKSDEEDNDEYDEEVVYEHNDSPEGDFDEPYFMSPATQLYTTFGCIMLSQRIDLFNPMVVRIIRFAFIAEIIVQQLFIVYVRIMAKHKNDRTPVTTQNPLSGALQSQLENSEAGGMMKTLASSFLSSETTAMEYDMKEAKNMQGGVLFNMAFVWFLHFRMEQVQPVLIQVVTGFLQLVYSPLFQVYILGRNLERPFKTAVSMAQKTKEAGRATTVSPGKDDAEDEIRETNDAYDEESPQEIESGEDNDAADDEADHGDEDHSDNDTDDNTEEIAGGKS